MIRTVVTLTGRVQGVGFRTTVLDLAARYPVAGTVRNLRDGARLEIDVEGEPAAVERFLDEVLERRPRFARVDRVERTAADPRGLHRFAHAPTA